MGKNHCEKQNRNAHAYRCCDRIVGGHHRPCCNQCELRLGFEFRPEFRPVGAGGRCLCPQGGDGQTNYNYQNDDPGHHRQRDDHGRIFVNERTFSAEQGVCTAVISSPATSFNVRNDSDKTVEFFTGITCDNGAAIATIGPQNSSSAIAGTPVLDAAVVPFALVGSFRAIDKRY
ncbi:hypothetical protein ACIBVL_25755 [Streptomyces sp. NPDC049687]|uniref:hypothetical protein n=1 Tax=Streptomyces sp. NPDC049687 TaxID=3365596 RepID=UPI0037A23519